MIRFIKKPDLDFNDTGLQLFDHIVLTSISCISSLPKPHVTVTSSISQWKQTQGLYFTACMALFINDLAPQPYVQLLDCIAYSVPIHIEFC